MNKNIIFIGLIFGVTLISGCLQEETTYFDITLYYVWGLGSSQIYVNSTGEIIHGSEVEGGYIGKRSHISKDDVTSLLNLIKNTNILQLEGRKEWATYRGGTYTLSIRLEENENQVSCDKSKCPEEVLNITNELESLSSAIFERPCVDNVDCSDIICKTGIVFYPEIKEEYTAKCIAVKEEIKECSCIQSE